MALRTSREHDSRDQWEGESSVAGSAGSATLVLDATGATSVRMPDTSFLTDGQFVRSGLDLRIELPDGRAAVVEGYFHGAQSPDLIGPDGGAALTPSLVHSFLGSLTPGQYAQAAPIATAQPIGQVDALEGQATALRTDGTRVTLEKGDPVFQGDVIETGGDASAIRLLFADKTMFALGPEARLALDELVFDPAGQEGSIQFSILKGVFIFASGQIAKTDNTDMTVTTPVATIGIRGTEVAGRVAEGDSQFTILDGAIEVTTRAGSVALDSRGETTDVTGIDSPPGAPYLLTPTEYAEAYKEVAGIAADYFGSGAPGGGDLPDIDDSGNGEQRGDLDQRDDGESNSDHAAAGDDGDPVVLARTLGGDTTTLFGSSGSSGEAWSGEGLVGTAESSGDPDAGMLLRGDDDGGANVDVDTATGDGVNGTESFLVTQESGEVTGAATSGDGVEPLFDLASGLTIDGTSTSSDTSGLASADNSGASSSPFRIAQGDQPPGWSNAYWGADGAPFAGDTDFSWLHLEPAGMPKLEVSGDDIENASSDEELLAPAGQEAPLELAEGITLVVSHKSINGNIQDPSESVMLPDLGPGSSVTISGGELGLTGIAGSAEISLTRDAVDSVDVTLNSVWNSIQNIRVESDVAGDVAVSNFVHTEVRLGDGGDSNVTITDAKRGFISTGDGNDQVSIKAASDGFSGSTTFEVHTGSGDDTLLFSGATDGKFVLAFDGGEGTDTLWLSGSATEFDLTSADFDLTGVERLAIGGDGDVTATLSADLVSAITGEYNEITASANTVVVDGDTGDSIDLGAGWSVVDSTEIDGAGYTIYEHADGARVVADSDITVA